MIKRALIYEKYYCYGVAHPQLFNKGNANLIMHTLFTFLLFEQHKGEMS